MWSQHPDALVTAQKHKMSKSRGNVVNPDDVVYRYGADSLRLYEMFLGPLQETKVRLVSLQTFLWVKDCLAVHHCSEVSPARSPVAAVFVAVRFVAVLFLALLVALADTLFWLLVPL